MVSIGLVVLAAVKSVASAMILFMVGALVSWNKLVDQKFLSQLSKVVKYTFLPFLTFTSISTGMSPEFLASEWQLAVYGMAVLGIGFLYSHFLVKVLDISYAMRPWFVLSVTVPNMIALPMVLVEAMCREEEPEQGAAARCVDAAITRLFMVTLSHTIIFWLGCVRYAKSFADAPSVEDAFAAGPPKHIGDESVVGEQIALTSSNHEQKVGGDRMFGELEKGGASSASVGRAQQEDEDTDIVLSPVSLGRPEVSHEELNSCVLELTTEGPVAKPRPSCFAIGDFLLDNPPVIALILGLAVATAPPLHRMLYGQDAPLSFLATTSAVIGKASPSVTGMIAGCSLGLQMLQIGADKQDPLGLRSLGVSTKAMIAMVVSRIIVVPMLCFGVLLMVLEEMPRDRWARLILFFQPAGVTANIVTLMAQLCNQPEAGKFVAVATIPQMLLYIPAATAFIAIGIYWNSNLS